MTIEDNILKDYRQILDSLDKSPGDEEAIDLLVNLEEDTKNYLFETLKVKYGENRNKSNIYEKFTKGKKDRDYLEGLVMKSVTGEKLSINDLTDSFLKKINDVLSAKSNTQEKIKLLNIQHIHLEKFILPPDYKKTPETGSGNGWIEKKLRIDKFSLLIQYFREWGIYTDDILVIDGIISEDMVRKQSYYCIFIPRINKTIFVNNSYGEATFIYEGILETERFTELGKKGLQTILQKIIFSEKNIDQRKQEIYESLFAADSTKKGKLGEKISIADFKDQIKNSTRKQEFLDFYDQLPEDERKTIIGSSKSYKKRAKKYPGVPKSYLGLISLLGGNKKCGEWGYIQALIEGRGEEYFKEWDKTEEQKKQEFLEFYDHLQEDERKIIISNADVYVKRAKKYPKIPKSYPGLISLLGGNKECGEGGYMKALIEGKGEVYFKNWNKQTNKTEEQKKQEFLEFYDHLPEDERKTIIGGSKSYTKRAKKHPKIPQSSGGLIFLLGGNRNCRERGYIQALIEGKGEKYFEEWKEQRNKTEQQKKQDFLDFYDQLPKEDRKIIISNASLYGKRAKKYPKAKQSYNGLISLLGGNEKCGEGGYVQALIEGRGEEYFKEWENKKDKKL